MKNFFTRPASCKTALLALLLLLGCFAVPAISSETSVIAPLASHSLLLDSQRVEDALIVVGERGHILLSTDNGGSWQQANVPTRVTLTGVYFFDRQNGWAVGHDQVILRSQDGGKNWQLVHENAEAESPLLDVYFRTAEHGYAIGAYGLLLETFDAGSSWQQRTISEDDFHLNQLVPAGNRLFIAAEAGLAYRSDDGGASWTVLTPDYTGSFFGILPLTDDSLLLFGLRGNLFRSDDAGETWQQLETATEASLTCGLRLADGRLVIAGLAGALLFSEDDGQSFTLQQDPERRGFSSLMQAADGKIVAVGDFGVSTLQLSNFNPDK